MSNLLQFQDVSKSYGLKNLFDCASFAVNEGEHVGVIGANGAGKSTLFKILVGQESPDSGIYSKSRSLRLGYLAQEDDWSIDQSLENLLSSRSSKPLWKHKEFAVGFGMDEQKFSMPLRELSGGYRMRAQLLCMIAEEPNLMLLDEPTNYLDLESLLFLENFLSAHESAFMVISHDRRFLNQISDHVLEVESPDLTKFPGNVDDYFEQKELLRVQLEKEALKQDAKRKHIMNFVDRFRAKATKARQAQSRLKLLEKMPTIDIKALPLRARIQIPPARSTGRLIASLKEVDLGYPGKRVLSDVNVEIERGDRIGVVGPNGAGKSTLLKALSQKLLPINGNVVWGPGVEVSYFSQHLGDALNMSATVESEISRLAHPEVMPQEVRALAGSLLFKDELDLQKKISVLSGGEKSRVALAQILLKKAPFLVLDEPTNHLDFDTVESLSQALSLFEGTLVVVSHDRDFISRVCSKILEIKDGRLNLYPGNYEEYLWSLFQGSYGTLQSSSEEKNAFAAPAVGDQSGQVFTSKSGLSKEQRKELREAEEKAKTAEKLYLKCERDVDRLSSEVIDGAPGAVDALNKAYKALEDAEKAWMECMEQVEKLAAR